MIRTEDEIVARIKYLRKKAESEDNRIIKAIWSSEANGLEWCVILGDEKHG